MSPSLILVPELFFLRGNKSLDMNTYEKPCIGNFAFLFEEEIENIPLTFFYYKQGTVLKFFKYLISYWWQL